MFASVADDGRIEIWDLKRDNLSPLICYFDLDAAGNKIHTAKTAIKFATTLPVLMTGDIEGRVHVYRTMGLEHDQVTRGDQIKRLQAALSKDDFTESKTDNNKDEESG